MSEEKIYGYFLKLSLIKNTSFHVELHNIYVEESGNPNGQPIIFYMVVLVGLWSQASDVSLIQNHYRIILFDQRGCGKSTPLGETQRKYYRRFS